MSFETMEPWLWVFFVGIFIATIIYTIQGDKAHLRELVGFFSSELPKRALQVDRSSELAFVRYRGSSWLFWSEVFGGNLYLYRKSKPNELMMLVSSSSIASSELAPNGCDFEIATQTMRAQGHSMKVKLVESSLRHALRIRNAAKSNEQSKLKN